MYCIIAITETAPHSLTRQLSHTTQRLAKQEASSIIEQANKRASQIVDEAKEQARSEGDRLKVAAQAEIEQEMNRAKEELRNNVATLALAGAEKVLKANIDESANRALVDDLAAQL